MTGDNGVIKRMQIGGIVRSTSAMNNADGNCEEIINLRQNEGVWRAIGEKNVKVQDIQYEQVLLHEYSDFENYLGVKKWSETEKDETGMTVVKTRRAVVWFDPDTKEEKQTICTVEGEATLEQINNILLVRDRSNIVKTVFVQGEYQKQIVDLPLLPRLLIDTSDVVNTSQRDEANDLHIDGSVFFDELSTSLGVDETDTYKEASGNCGIAVIQDKYSHFIPNPGSLDAANQTLKGLYNMHVGMDDEHRSGYVALSYCYELYDGTETKMAPLQLINLGTEYNPALFRIYRIKNTKPSDAHLNTETDGYDLSISIKGVELHSLKINLSDLPDYETYKDVISQINVYVSQVIDVYDWDNFDMTFLMCRYKGKLYNLRMSTAKHGLPEKKLKSTDLSKLLLYRVGEFKFGETPVQKTVSFKDLTTNPTMPVDASGWMNTSGDMFVYNNRLHLSNIKQTFTEPEGMSFISEPVMEESFPADFFFYIRNNTREEAVVHVKGKVGRESLTVYFPNFIAFADSRAYKCEVFVKPKNGLFKTTVFLNPSATYNVAFAVNTPPLEIDKFREVYEIDVKENSTFTDSSKILVSEIANPYFFPPEHSYSLPGEIINLAVNTQQISASQIGQFPLYAFTTEGIYALQQGEGKVLYSNVIPVSAEVAVKGSSVLQTKYGIVFVTADGLKLISGSEVVDLSEAVKGRIDEYFMKQRSYSMILEDSWLWNASPFISRIPFEEYIQEAVMGYDIVKDEIIVSNPAYRYSYVYSLKTKTWHKITEVFSSFSRHLALKQNWPSGHDVCDIREEVKGIRPVFMLTRPVNLGNFGYNMVYHYCMRGEIRPLKEEERCNSLSVFLSNDLQYWEFGPQANPIIDMPVVPLDRLLCASRYFRLLYTGEVEPEHTLALVEMDGEEKFDNKIR